MKIKIKVYVFVILSVIYMPSLYAAWSGWTKVNQVYQHGNGNVYFKFDTMINPSPCQLSTYIIMSSGHAAIDRLYSLALVAKATASEVRYYVSGCHSTYPYPSMQNLEMR